MSRVEPPSHARPADLRHRLLEEIGVVHGFGLRDGTAPRLLVCPRQVHGVGVAAVRDGSAYPAEADAIVSGEPGFPVGVVTADCVPVLAASRDGAAVVAIHAGWRGLAAGVVEQGIAALQARCPAGSRLRAVVGPHIGACCYEVDEPVVVPLRARFGAGLDAALRPAEAGHPGHWRLDLAFLVAVELQRMGISDADRGVVANPCTACQPERFHSYRRDGARAGRLVHHIAAGCGPAADRA